MTRQRKPKPFSDQIRQAVDDSGLTRYRICKTTGIDQSALGKFCAGERGLSLESLDLIAECIGMVAKLERKGKHHG